MWNGFLQLHVGAPIYGAAQQRRKSNAPRPRQGTAGAELHPRTVGNAEFQTKREAGTEIFLCAGFFLEIRCVHALHRWKYLQKTARNAKSRQTHLGLPVLFTGREAVETVS